jgi:hypothetical protein
VLGLLAYSVSSLSPTTPACRLAVCRPLLFLLQIPAGSLSLSKEQRITYVFVQILFYLWLTRYLKKILANITIDRKLQPVVVFLGNDERNK